MDLEENVFKKSSPHAIALSIKHSAEQSHTRKTSPFRSAMSMLNFYINRAGKNLSQRDSEILERAKHELRKLFHHESVHREQTHHEQKPH
jgi:hypothetical protein